MIQLSSIRLRFIFAAIFILLNLTLQAENTINLSKDTSTVKDNAVVQADGSLSPPYDAALQAQDTLFEARKFAVIVRVVDGDTIKVNYGGKNEYLKLIGINAPENRLSRKAKSEAIASGENLLTIVSIGIDAERFIESHVKKGDIVTVEFDIETKNANGMLLGYVFLSDGKMLNEEIVRAGYANIVNGHRNMKYQQKLIKAYKEAKVFKRGLWE
jgi:micrococcal nuclease